jgi:hypothetical protein
MVPLWTNPPAFATRRTKAVTGKFAPDQKPTRTYSGVPASIAIVRTSVPKRTKPSREEPLPAPLRRPLGDASEAELKALVDDVLQSNRFHIDTGEVVKPQTEPRFHVPSQTIVERQEASAESGADTDKHAALPPSKGRSEAREWFLAILGKPVGPLTLPAMQELWNDETIEPDMLCWRQGFADWVHVRQDPLLVEAFGARPLDARARKKETTGRWKPIAGPVLERLRKMAAEGSREIPPIPAAPSMSMHDEAAVRVAVQELTPLLTQSAAPAKSSLLFTAVVSGLVSGLLVAVAFLSFIDREPPRTEPALPALQTERSTPPPSPIIPAPAPIITASPPAPAEPAPVAAKPRPTHVRASSARETSAVPAPSRSRDGFEETFTGSDPPKPEKKSEPANDLPETLDQSTLMAAVLEHKEDAAECLTQFPPENPDAPRALTVRWTILGDGSVTDIGVQTEEYVGSPVASCLSEKIVRWRFPKHRSEGVPFAFPFRFARAE